MNRLLLAWPLRAVSQTSPPARAGRALAFLSVGAPILILGLTVFGRFDGLYGQDAYAYYNYASGPLRDSLLAFQPWPAFFWPPGYPLLVSLITLVVGKAPAAGQIVSLAAGFLVPVLTALLGREILGRERWRTALLAGLIAGFVGQLWQSSVVLMSDTAGLAAAALGMWALARCDAKSVEDGRGSFGWLVIASAAMAFAILTRWAYALVGVIFALYAVSILLRMERRRAVLHGALAALVGLAILWPLVAPVIGEIAATSVDQSAFVGNLRVHRWSAINAVRREFSTLDGLLRYRFPNGLYYALAPAHRFYFTPLIAALILPGLWGALRQAKPASFLVLVGWPAAIYALHAGAPWQNLRHSLVYLPPLAILAALGAERLAGWRSGIARWPVVGLLAAGILWMGVGGWSLTQSFIDRKNETLEIVRWVERALPPEATLLTFGLTGAFEHYASLDTQEFFFMQPTRLETLLEGDRAIYLLLDVANVESQWRGLQPAENLEWLRRGPGLSRIGERGGYSLYRVQPESPR